MIRDKMARQSNIFLIFIATCMLFGLTHGIIGKNVRYVQHHEKFLYTVSIARKALYHHLTEFVNLHICTGTIVSHKSIITVAHCLENKKPSDIEIIAGSENLSRGVKYYPEWWITFSEWNHNRTAPYPHNNIAVITVSGEGIINSTIHPAPILTVDNEYLHGKEVRILGWGQIEEGIHPTILKTAWLKVVSNKECSEQGTMLTGKPFSVPPNYFCSKANPWVLSTLGDGGGPILDKTRHLVGINIGTVPKVEGYPKEVLNELQMNSHLNFHYYKDFLNHVIIK